MVLLLITSSNIEWNLTDCSVNNNNNNNVNSTTTTTSNIPFDSDNHSSSNTTNHHQHHGQEHCESVDNNSKRNNAVSKTSSRIIRKKSVRLRRPAHANPISRGVRRMRRGLMKKSLIRLVCRHDSFKRHPRDERIIGKTFGPAASSNTLVNSQLGGNNVSYKRRNGNAAEVMSAPALHNHTGNSPNGSNMGSLTLSNRSTLNITATSAPSSSSSTATATASGTQATPLASGAKQRRQQQQKQEQFIRLYARKKRLRRRRKRKSIANNLHVSASSSEAAAPTAPATAGGTATTATAPTSITRANTTTTNYVMFKEIHQTGKQLQQQQQLPSHHRQLPRHKQQHQMGRAITAMRLFLTTIATLAAHTTSITLAATSTCLASATAAITIAATTLPAVWPQRFASLAANVRGVAAPGARRASLAPHGRDRERLPTAGFHRHASITTANGNGHASTTDSSSGSSGSRLMMHELHKYSWIFLLIYLNLSAKVCLAGYHEKRLLHDLLDPYNTLERPVLNESDPLQLSFGLTLMQIIDVDEKNQLLVTNVWLKLEWNDMNLRWNTSDYGGVKDLRIPPHRIWKPDVLMYNSADEGFDGTYQTNVVVRNNGSCLYVPPGIFKSTCKIDITWFPFDDQRCEMKFGSWTYDGFQLDLQLQDETGGDISSYVLNGEWELLGVPGKRNEIYYNCCPEPYIDITFAIIIRRRTLYYFFNLIIPCVLIASMALLGFTLPPDSGEKLSLGVTILLSLTVFLNMVAETMPATSDAVPLLGTYFNCIMFMVASSVVSTILILNYHHRNADTHEMSEWIRVVFLCWLPWILRMSRPGRPLILEFPTTPCSDTPSERKHQILSDVELKERSSKSLLANVLDIDDDFRHNCRPMTPGGTLPHNPAFYRTVYGQGDDGSIGPIGSTRMPDAVSHQCVKSSTEYELGLILKEIRFITDQLRKDDEDNDVANDWKFAAMVVDRLCLIIFTMFTILATIAVLLSAPHIIVS